MEKGFIVNPTIKTPDIPEKKETLRWCNHTRLVEYGNSDWEVYFGFSGWRMYPTRYAIIREELGTFCHDGEKIVRQFTGKEERVVFLT